MGVLCNPQRWAPPPLSTCSSPCHSHYSDPSTSTAADRYKPVAFDQGHAVRNAAGRAEL